MSIADDIAEAEEGEVVCVLAGFGGIGREGDLGGGTTHVEKAVGMVVFAMVV